MRNPSDRLSYKGHHAGLVLRLLLSLLPLALVGTAICAQAPSTSTQGWSDADLPRPTLSHQPLGHADPAAKAELEAFQRATNGEAWSGMKASGTMTQSGTANGEQAQLSMLLDNRTRLEVTTAAGQESTVTRRGEGHIHYDHDDRGYHDTDKGAHSGPRNVPLSPEMAAAGLIPFDLPYAILKHPERFSLTDRGGVTLAGIAAHRVTVEIPLRASGLLTTQERTVPEDLYFDVSTHLLLKTASTITLEAFGMQRLLRVITYGDYQSAGPATVPYSLSETIDGRQMWSLKLNTVDTVNLPSADKF